MAPFRLALYPVDASRWPSHLREQGYFEFRVHGVRVDGKCLGARRLPDYPLVRVRLGQYVPGRVGGAWETEVPL